MKLSQVAGIGLQIWRITKNLFNQQSRTTKGLFSSLGVGRGLTAPHRKQLACYKMLHRASDLDSLEWL